MVSFATYFNHQNYRGREATLDEFRGALREYSRDPLVYLCAAISAMLKDNPNPSDDEIYHGLDGNLCRCTGYINIVKAVKRSAEVMQTRK